MTVILDMDKVFFMVGSATCLIIPTIVGLYFYSRYKVVQRKDWE